MRTGLFFGGYFSPLHEALPDYLRAVATLACTTGWRKGEILGLTWDRVDMGAGTVRLDPGSTKNREGRTVVLTEELRAVLAAQWAKARAIVEARQPAAPPREVAEAIPWVFHHDGQRIRSFRRAWLSACRKAGLEGRIPHDLRRTAIRNMVRVGIPERLAMQISGHKTRAIFDRYDIVSEAGPREAAERLKQCGTGVLLSACNIPFTCGPGRFIKCGPTAAAFQIRGHWHRLALRYETSEAICSRPRAG